jgi:hypothetical protein
MGLHITEAEQLPLHAGNLWRLKKAGYADSRVTGLTTVATLITDLETFAGLINAGLRPLVDAAIQTIKWMESRDTPLIDTTLVTALTTVYDVTVSATTDLSYLLRGHSQYPASASIYGTDITYILPTYAA